MEKFASVCGCVWVCVGGVNKTSAIGYQMGDGR